MPIRLAALSGAWLAAAFLLIAAPAEAQGSVCPPGHRLLRYEDVMTPQGPARRPFCVESIRVHLWIKAFIPNDHPGNPGYVVRTASGRTPIPDPYRDWADRLGGRGTCFLTDQRMFESRPEASARISIEMDLIIEEGSIVRAEPHRRRGFVTIGRTENVDCGSGALRATDRARSRGDEVSPSDGSSVAVRASIGNPFYPLGPAIDMHFRVTLEPSLARMVLAGQVGIFPAFEGYYAIDGGPPQTLFQLMPQDGTTARDLIDAMGYINMRDVSAVIPLR